MSIRTIALTIFFGLITTAALPQTAAESARQPAASSDRGEPVFRIVLVGRTLQAINFRPRDGETKIDFVGTPLSPRAHGDATVEGEDGVIEIDANFETLESPAKFGPEYLTYVLWAITPEGRASNLGELQVSGDDGEMRVTTELQAFGLIVTAEPYFAVTRPSDVVVMESRARDEGVFQDRTIGRVEPVEVKYELLGRGTYLMNQDPSRLRETLEPGAPLDIAQARNAVAIAKLAGADRYAAETFTRAARLLAEAEGARERGDRGNELQQPARQAVQTAEEARLMAVRRMEEEYRRSSGRSPRRVKTTRGGSGRKRNAPSSRRAPALRWNGNVRSRNRRAASRPKPSG